ncbi:MAG TPA: MarR family winged helix-turn-helix transcriptional regulator [Mycobacteriales bacterium]|nr:MarR family winged helix-turn-helix transcriptional regulator [Mycobacteriales bacterium]
MSPEEPALTHGWTLARLARQLEQSLAEADVSLPQYRVLMILARGERRTPSRVAGELAVSPPSITAVVDGLVARGLVERHHDAVDRRQVVHAITDAGRDLLHVSDAAVQARLGTVLDHLGERDAQAARRGLDLWHEALVRAHRAACATPAGEQR